MNALDKWLGNETEGLVKLRRQLHTYPELGMEEHKTAARVAQELRAAGIEVTEGVGGTGVVGAIRGKHPGNKSIGLRADMDALAILEDSGVPYASATPGKMHACGHDGHTTMLLGAAKYLAQHRDFSGSVHVIFQPAEETLTGAAAMLKDGLLDRFPCDAVYGLHNTPGMPVGRFAIRTGPMMAAADTWRVTFRGRGGHGGLAPHLSNDITYVQAQFVLGLQGIVGRNVPPNETAVVSVGYILGGAAANVVPSEMQIGGTLRCFSPETRALLQKRIGELAEASAATWGAQAEYLLTPGVGPLVNDAEKADLAYEAAASFAGSENVVRNLRQTTGSEDFAFMLEARPGAFMRIGNGVEGNGAFHPLHTPGYDFNDDIIPLGVRYWVAVVEKELPSMSR
jgi:amidohydrolase